MVTADGSLVGVLEIAPGFACKGHDVGGEFGGQVLVFPTAQAGDMVAGDRVVRGVAETGRGAQAGVGEGFLRHLAVADQEG
ncbi:hypothetical protein ACWEQN_34215 [Streptomyces sp. NPDC004129]